MAKKKVIEKTVAVIDFETDPFLFEQKPWPFSAGFKSKNGYVEFVGTSDRDDSDYDPMRDCVINLINYIFSLETPHIIYAHNGGKFDFMYLLEHNVLDNPMLIIHGRITKCGMGIHELRDSYSIMPLPLKKIIDADVGKKLDMDYNKLKRDVRHLHMTEILAYQKQDCDLLYAAVVKFRERFGDKLTVGAASISEIGKHHRVYRLNKKHDREFRDFYFGGRVECFEAGKLEGDFKFFDVNSMYSFVMRNYEHPLGERYVRVDAARLCKSTGNLSGFGGMYFIHFRGCNNGALPARCKETGKLRFDIEVGDFYTTSHELKVALEFGLIKIEEIYRIDVPCSFDNFKTFIDIWSAEKRAGAIEQKGGLRETFAKLIQNAGYGKYGTNAEDFCEWYIYDHDCDENELEKFNAWREQFPQTYHADGSIDQHGAIPLYVYERFEMWQAEAPKEDGYFDVAVAASITSAARSILLRAWRNAIRPVYCDTDSLVCLDLKNVVIDELELGAWKFEGSCDTIYIAGKKLYSAELHQKDKHGCSKFKTASKGAKLSHADIIRLCAGEIVTWKSDAPNFKFSGETKFVARNIRKRV